MEAGRITGATGAIVAGTGFTVARTAAGTYTITFTSAFSTAPAVTANVLGATTGFVRVASITTSAAQLITSGTNGTAADRDFTFVAAAI